MRKSSGMIALGSLNNMGARRVYSPSPFFLISVRSCAFSFFLEGLSVNVVGSSFRLEKIEPAQSLMTCRMLDLSELTAARN